MNLIQILALCATLVVSPLRAEDDVCASYAGVAFTATIKANTDVRAKCGGMVSVFDYYSPPTKALCAKPGCVEEMKKAVQVVPTCVDKMAKTNLNTLVLGVVKMCENEAKEGNLPVAGSGSLDTGAGSLSLNDTASVGDLPISTEEEDAKIKELGDSKEREKACGKPGDDYTNVRDSPRCSRPECLAYYKDTYLKMMPDCRDKAYMKLYIARCEAVPETAPAPSSSTTTIPSLVVTGIVALTALLGRKEKPHEMLFIASKPGCGQAQAT